MDPFDQKDPSGKVSDSDLEATVKAPDQSGQSPSPATTPQSPPGPSSQYEASQPIPIPNAVPKQRLPRIDKDGFIFKSGAFAPHPMNEVEDIKKLEEEEDALAERHRRAMQSMMKWDAEQKRLGEPAKQPSALTGRVPSDQSLSPQQDSRVGNALMLAKGDEVPDYQKNVMKPFSHQYGHTAATIAYDEGLKTGAEGQGSKAVMDARQKAYMQGYDDGFRDGQSHQ
ncbi:hypothetical protein GQX73_g609 [Xylaria multiplex]|uniref:Uncharacterized protein n=1 Tax=Xylaria multiplex TaxID=323545 RepID=A0A7C8IUY2_9PEZI|nr:hypothetical protein GQX73_g609 [Xylaria multiplex]